MISELVLVGMLLILGCSHDIHYSQNENIFTLVTGLFNSATQDYATQVNNIRAMMASPFNLIVVVQNDLMQKVSADVVSNKTLLLPANALALGDNWQDINNNILSKSTQKDSNLLDYARLLWLNYAHTHDTFDTDEFIWVDLDYFSALKEFLTLENIDLLVTEYKHHFFYQT